MQEGVKINGDINWRSNCGNLSFIIPVEPVADLLKGTPASIERVITGLDKFRTRAVEKEEGNSTMYTEQILKGMLKSLEQA